MSAQASPLTFPVPTGALADWLPHRGPAIWVDEVRWVERDSGECRVILRREANYADERGRLRPSSFVEWMAQSFGYVGACQALLGLGCDEPGKAEKPEKVFLVQVREFGLVGDPDLTIRAGAHVDVRVRRTHQLGPITLVEGEVRDGDRVLAKAKLKLFAS